ncbi:MAG: hypothetical protein HQ582_33245, partial [Planctomycetes bacterium]|nr:hypothetical protein [Planctomycetota bacterium]
MKPITKAAQAVFDRLVRGLTEVGDHRKVDNSESCMAVSVEIIGRDSQGKPLISIAHYYTQAGDMMRDPDMVFVLSNAQAFPIGFQQDNVGIQPILTPDKIMDSVPYEQHTAYLASDLITTELLYRHLWGRLTKRQRAWTDHQSSTLTKILAGMTITGWTIDADFIVQEQARLQEQMGAVDAEHQARHGFPAALTPKQLPGIFFRKYKLPNFRQGIDQAHREILRKYAEIRAWSKIADSLALLDGWQRLRSLSGKLRSFLKKSDRHNDRVHSTFRVQQSSGRVSSSDPNAPQMAGERTVLEKTPFEITVVTRNLAKARPGHILVAADVASRVTGQQVTKSSPTRGTWKVVFLSLINGQGVGGIADKLGVTVDKAKGYIAEFETAYPDVVGILALRGLQLALSGHIHTWTGRYRRVTPIHWCLTEPRVRIFQTFKGGEKYWFDVIPLRPSLRNLTCFVKKVWAVEDYKTRWLVYTDSRGRIGDKYYPRIDDRGLLYRHPFIGVNLDHFVAVRWAKSRAVETCLALRPPVLLGGGLLG